LTISAFLVTAGTAQKKKLSAKGRKEKFKISNYPFVQGTFARQRWWRLIFLVD
jgi:hypothetical protein